METSKEERTEKATPKRLEEARKKGQVAKSREVPSALVLLFSLVVFSFLSSWMITRIATMMRGVFNRIASVELQNQYVQSLMVELGKETSAALMPLMGAIAVAGVAGHLVQAGFLFTGEPLSPNLGKLDPVKGIGRLFSLKSLVEVIKCILKISVVGGVAFLVVRREAEGFPGLMQMNVGQILSFTGTVSLKIGGYICVVLMALAFFDYAFQRWQHGKDLRMTKEEVKQEYKQREGDPMVKARIRKVQNQLAQRRMMEAVPEADVVVTNPTHLAVALLFNGKTMAAPKVVAKGAGFVAEKIREIARESGVPVVEDKFLARTLYKVVEIGEVIPVELYRAVAEILAYVYKLKGKKA